MESQLKQQGAGDRLQEVLLEVPNVRKDAGYPPLVTPSSQIVGTQAVFNVMMGRYKVHDRRIRRPDARLLRQARWAAKDPEVLAKAETACQEEADHVPPGRPAEAGVGRTCAATRWRSRDATAPTKTC